MKNIEFTSEEEWLIRRLQNAPQPELSREALDVIRVRMLDAVGVPVPALPGGFQLSAVVVVIVLLVITAVLIAALVIVSSAPQITATAAPILPAAATGTLPPAASPTMLPSATASMSSTVTPSPTLTLSPSPTATPSPLPTLSHTPVPTAAAAPTEAALIVIEGVVQAVDGLVITIFDIPVTLAADDPLVGVIQVGDTVRIEGLPQAGGAIIAVSVTFTLVEVEVDASSGEVWRDDGSCANPPPDWAPANGWRRRCQGQDQPQGQGQGRGMGGDDDD